MTTKLSDYQLYLDTKEFGEEIHRGVKSPKEWEEDVLINHPEYSTIYKRNPEAARTYFLLAKHNYKEYLLEYYKTKIIPLIS